MDTRRSLLGWLLLLSPIHPYPAPVAFGLAPLVQLGASGGSPPCRAEVSQVLLAEPGFGDLAFGWAVVLDGEELLVGAPGIDGDRPGAVQVFRETPAGYAFSERILPSNSAVGDGFGSMLLVEGDRLFAVSGSPFTGTVVLVFARQTSGPSSWVEVAQIPLPPISYPYRYFSMDADENVLVLTTPWTLQVHERDQGGPDAWGITKLIPLPAVIVSQQGIASFGPSVAVDGSTIVATVPEDDIHPYWLWALVFERDLDGPSTWGFAGLLRQDPEEGFGYLMQLQEDFLFLEGRDAFVYARDPITHLFAEVRTLPCPAFLPCALRVRDGLVARAGCAAVGFQAKLLIHRRSIGSSGVPVLGLLNETLFPGLLYGFYSIDVQGERVVLGAPMEASYAGEVLVVDLACPRAQVPLALAPR